MKNRETVIPRIYCPLNPIQPSPRDPDIEAQLSRFAAYLRSCGRSAHTVRLYLGTLRRWFAAGGATLHVDAERLRGYLYARRKACSQSTINLDLRGIRAWLRYQHVLGTLEASAELVKLPRQRRAPQRLPRYLDDDQIGRAMAIPDPTTLRGLRDLLILRLLYESGLRSGELIGLDIGDVQPDGWLYIAHAKFGKCRYVPVSAETVAMAGVYVERRRAAGLARSRTLLVGRAGKPLKPQTVWAIVSRCLRAAAGIGAGYGMLRSGRTARPWSGHYPHMLRASFATALLNNGCPITAIAEMLGHEDLATTAIYCGVDLALLKRAAACHPRFHRSP